MASVGRPCYPLNSKWYEENTLVGMCCGLRSDTRIVRERRKEDGWWKENYKEREGATVQPHQVGNGL